MTAIKSLSQTYWIISNLIAPAKQGTQAYPQDFTKEDRDCELGLPSIHVHQGAGRVWVWVVVCVGAHDQGPVEEIRECHFSCAILMQVDDGSQTSRRGVHDGR